MRGAGSGAGAPKKPPRGTAGLGTRSYGCSRRWLCRGLTSGHSTAAMLSFADPPPALGRGPSDVPGQDETIPSPPSPFPGTCHLQRAEQDAGCCSQPLIPVLSERVKLKTR